MITGRIFLHLMKNTDTMTSPVATLQAQRVINDMYGPDFLYYLEVEHVLTHHIKEVLHTWIAEVVEVHT